MGSSTNGLLLHCRTSCRVLTAATAGSQSRHSGRLRRGLKFSNQQRQRTCTCRLHLTHVKAASILNFSRHTAQTRSSYKGRIKHKAVKCASRAAPPSHPPLRLPSSAAVGGASGAQHALHMPVIRLRLLPLVLTVPSLFHAQCPPISLPGASDCKKIQRFCGRPSPPCLHPTTGGSFPDEVRCGCCT